MPRRDDEFDDDRPRRQPRDDDDDDRPRSRRDDDDLDDRPRRRRFEDDDDAPPPRARKKGGSLGLILGIIAGVLILVCGGGIVGLYYAVSSIRESAERMQSRNNIMQVGLACHNYNDINGAWPTNSYSPDGRPLLSWRVHILPYIEEDFLYKQFKLNEPWDSPTNIQLLNRMPKIYAAPIDRSGAVVAGNRTYYRGFSSPGAMFARRDGGRPAAKGKFDFDPPAFVPLVKGVRITDITDGTTNTIVALEAGESVEWSKPDDLDASPGKPFPPLGGVRPKSDTLLVLMADGSVRAVKKTLPEAQWRAAITIAGGEAGGLD